MSNKDCTSVYSTTDANKKNLLQRVFSSAAQLFSSTKAKYKHNQKTHSAPTKSLPPLPSTNRTHKTTQFPPSPPCIANDGASRSAYEADPIFTALDANYLPDLTLFISGENKPTCAQKNVPTFHPDPKEVPMARVSTPISQTGQNHVITDAITPVTPPKDTPSCDISAMTSTASSRLTSPPPTPSCPISSSTLLSPKRASSLNSSSSSKILSTPSSPSSTDLQLNLQIRIRNAADFETGVRTIDQEEILAREALKGSRIKRSNSLSLSLISTSPSAYAGPPSDNNLPNLLSVRTPELPPVLDVSRNDRGQFPTPDTPGASGGLYVTSSPSLPRCSNRRASNETEHDKEDISNRKATLRNKFDSTGDTVKPGADFANILASPPPSHIEKRRLFGSNILTINSNADFPSGRNPVSQFTISACRQLSLSASNTRRPAIPFFPNSQVTPPPTPTFSVPQPAHRSTKMQLSSLTELQNQSANNVDLNVTGAKNDANANAAKIASCMEQSKPPRLRSSYCKKIEYNETITVAPNRVSGIDGDFGTVWKGYDSIDDYDIEEQSGDEEVKTRYDSVPFCQDQEVGTLIWKNVESG